MTAEVVTLPAPVAGGMHGDRVALLEDIVAELEADLAALPQHVIPHLEELRGYLDAACTGDWGADEPPHTVQQARWNCRQALKESPPQIWHRHVLYNARDTLRRFPDLHSEPGAAQGFRREYASEQGADDTAHCVHAEHV